MLLVPPETFISQLDPYTQKISNLDKKMEMILKQKDIDEFNKALQYQQALQQYMSVRDKLLQPTPIPIVEQTSEKQNTQTTTQTTTALPTAAKGIHENVVMTVPKKLQTKAERLVNVIEKIPGLSWNDRGEMVLNGEVHRGSHYVDLINDVLHHRKTKIPVGWEALANALNRVNVPHDLIGNEARWSYMRGMHQAQTPEKSPRKSRSTTKEATMPTPPPSKRKKRTHSTPASSRQVKQINWDFDE